MPVIFPVIKSVLSDAVGKAIASAQRYFLPMDPVLNSYGTLDTAFTPSGDFEVEALVSTSSSSALNILSGTLQANDSIILNTNTSGQVRFLAYAGLSLQTSITSTSINDGKLHLIKATYTGTTAELFIDGVSQGTQTWALDGNQDIVNVGFRPGLGRYFDGYIADVKLTDLSTSSNSRIFPLAIGSGTTENSTINTGSITINNIPDADRELFIFEEVNDRWIGSTELVTNGMFDSDTDWTKQTGWTISGGELVATAAAASTATFQTCDLSVASYKYSIDVTTLAAGTLGLRIGGTFIPTGDITTSGTYSGTMTSGMTDNIVRLASKTPGPLTATIDNLSVKRILEVA